MNELIRLNKFLSEAGVCSRRQADIIVEQGKVTVNGQIATLGMKVSSSDEVEYNGKVLNKVSKTVILAFNKPMGLVCTSSGADKDNIFDYIKYPLKLTYVGRLDKDSQGLILLTNDGDLSNKIQKSCNDHEKEYLIRVNQDITEEFLKGMRNGVPILDTVTKRCKVEKTGTRNFKITLTQGLNRQIRRMCDYFGYKVVFLKRIRVMNIRLLDLKVGEYRELTAEEEKKLREMLK